MQTKRKATFMDVYGFVLAHLWLAIPLAFFFLVGSAHWAVLFFFIGMPAIDRLLGVDNATVEYTEAQEKTLQRILLAYPISHGLTIVATLAILAMVPMPWFEALGLALATGMALAGQGDATAHELGHNANPWARFGARFVLATLGYGHFQISHVRQHHVWVGTPKDPVSAPRGMSFYRYVVPCLTHEYVDAWKSELARLKSKSIPVWSWRNEMLMTLLATSAIGGASYAVAGIYGLFLFAATVGNGFLLLAVVNYLEHYGLEREEIGSGKYEKVTAIHTWNAPYKLTNWLWFNLPRHPDHHMHGGRKYYQLESLPEAPVLPSSYVGMMPVIMIPSLWFKIAHPRIDALRQERNRAA